MTKIICGVDVSSETLACRVGSDGVSAQFANSADGVAELAAFCRAQAVELVVMEATGGYEQQPFALLWAHGLSCAIVNPRSVRRFAEAMGILEKTDRIDAGVIAWYAAAKRVAAQQPASQTQQALAAAVSRLRQLTDSRVREINQRRLVSDPQTLETFTAVLAAIATQIRILEKRIIAQIRQDPLWHALDAAFRTIKGVADRTVARTLAELPEIGTLSAKAISKLTGLAPIARDSGKTKGKRMVRGGRAGVRSTLFVVAEVVRRHDPDFAAFHHRLTAAGKPKKVIRTALAHKLLVRLNAKARDIRAAHA